MSLFNLPIIHEEKEVSRHPWEKTVKDLNSNKIKYAHNSVHNPPYPKKKEKERAPEKDRVKFAVIGNRVTKEFIYCAKMVQGMHRYKSKIYDPPVVKGVTSVEWPSVLNNLKIEYGGLAYCLSSQVAVLHNDRFLGGEKELRELIESQYIYHLTIDYYKESVNQFAGFVKASGRSFAYMHISIDNKHIGTFIFMLYTDIVPKTCENFLRLCKNRKGGYSGTPVHRIVKDGWIQCGGFGLKSVKMDCENFIVPHDKRGVLAMANDGRHVDCSTQFFVLLQPAPWMQSKYVAFGQLVDGNSTLKVIEEIPTWYESPMAEIIIHKAGILNIDCQDIMINPGAKAYIDGHIDDLVTIGEIFYEALMEQVFLEIEFRLIARMEQKGEQEEDEEKADGTAVKQRDDIRATERFMRRKEEIHSQLNKMQRESMRASVAHSKAPSEKSNKEFDVDVYEYEPEEYTYPQASAASVSEPPKEKRPFYIPLTDVPYPDEVSSEYDLKKFLKGDYCLESDLAPVDAHNKVIIAERKWSYTSDLFSFFNEDQDEALQQGMDDLDSDDEEEINKYLKDNVDRVSFAGVKIKEVAKGIGMVNLFEKIRKSELISDEILRRYRLASMVSVGLQEKKVSISVPMWDTGTHTKIKRRVTGFIRPEDLPKVRKISMATQESNAEEEETEKPSYQIDRKVSVSINMPEEIPEKHKDIKRRQTGFVRPQDLAKIRIFKKGSIDDEEIDEDEDDEVFDPSNRGSLAEEEDISQVIPKSIRKFPDKKDEEQMKEAADEAGDKVTCLTEEDEDKKEELVTKEEMDRIHEFVKDQELYDVEDNEFAPVLGATRKTEVKLLDDAEKNDNNVKGQQMSHSIQENQKEEIEEGGIKEGDLERNPDGHEYEEKQEEEKPVPELRGKKSKTQSTVSINVPFDYKELHNKIQRRETGLIKPEELAKIRKFVRDQNVNTGYNLEEENENKTEVKLPDDAEEKYNKIKTRQTSFAKPDILSKVRVFPEDEEIGDEDVERDLGSTRRNEGVSIVSIIEPEDAKIHHKKIKRRQTGFVSQEQLNKIREMVKNEYNSDEEDDDICETRNAGVSTVSIIEPEDAKTHHEKIKRRQTGLVSPEQLTKIREMVKGEHDSDEENDDDIDKKRSQGPSTVSINEPEGAKEVNEKIKRRQTGFVSQEQLTKIREFAKDLDEEEEEGEKAVNIREPEGAAQRHKKIVRRQTGFVKPQEIAKLRAELGDEDEEDDDAFAEQDINVNLPVTEPTKADKQHQESRKSRQTSFAAADQLKTVLEYIKDGAVDDEGQMNSQQSTPRSINASAVSINEPEGAKEIHEKIKRRQTGFVSPEQLTKIREFAKELDDEEEEDEEEVKNINVTAPVTKPTYDDNQPQEATKSRQTSLAGAGELKHVLEFVKEKVVDEEAAWRNTRSLGPSVVSIHEPEGAKEIHNKIKRRQTGFVSADQLTKIREFVKDINIEEEEDSNDTNESRQTGPSTVLIKEPEGAKTTPGKVKRRQTGFVSREQWNKIMDFIEEEEDEEGKNKAGINVTVPVTKPTYDDKLPQETRKSRQTSFAGADEFKKVLEYIHENVEDKEVALHTTRSLGPSVVSIHEPEGAKEIHNKIKRRQTGFVSADQLTKIREFVKDMDIEEEEDANDTNESRQTGPSTVLIKEPEGAKTTPGKVKRRQTGFVSREQWNKIMDFIEEEEDEEGNNKAVINVTVPDTKPTYDDKLPQETRKSRQTSFAGADEFKKVLEYIHEDVEDKEVALHTTRSLVPSAVSINEPEGAKEVHNRIKRRQTGFVSAEQLTKIREFVKDIDIEEEEHLNDANKSRHAVPSTVIIKEPKGAKKAHGKVKRRQTGFVSREQLNKIKDFIKDVLEEDEEDEEDKDKAGTNVTVPVTKPTYADKQPQETGKIRQMSFAETDKLKKVHEYNKDEVEHEEVALHTTRSLGPSVVSINEPEGAKEIHNKIKRRQTGFVSADQLTKIREFVKDMDIEEEEHLNDANESRQTVPSTVLIKEPEGAKTTPGKIKRRQTGFLTTEQLNKIMDLMIEEFDKEEEDEEKARHKGAIVINEPEGAKTTHEKIKRRQTGFIRTENAEKLQAMAQYEEVDEDESLGASVVSINEPEGAKEVHNRIKRRQTSFVSADQLTKIREFVKDMDIEEEEHLNDANESRRGVVQIREPDSIKKKSEKIKRRQTGFYKPQDFSLDEDEESDDYDKENAPDTNNRSMSVTINLPENADRQSQIKRRQTGFARPQDLAKLLATMDADEDDEDDDDDDDGDTRKYSNSKGSNSKSKAEQKSGIAEYSDEVAALFVTFKGFDQRECKKHRKVRIDPRSSSKMQRPADIQGSDTQMRQSVLTRLYEVVKKDEDTLPTLKDYRPMSESQQQKNILLTFSQNQLSGEPEDKYFRPSIKVDNSLENVLNLQHGKKVTRKISSDYVNTIDQIERPRPEHSIRSVEYAKTRPFMTVAQYQKRNRLYQEERKRGERK